MGWCASAVWLAVVLGGCSSHVAAQRPALADAALPQDGAAADVAAADSFDVAASVDAVEIADAATATDAGASDLSADTSTPADADTAADATAQLDTPTAPDADAASDATAQLDTPTAPDADEELPGLDATADAAGDATEAAAPDAAGPDAAAPDAAAQDVEPPCDPTACNDGNACTVDSCVTSVGCEHEPVTGAAACDDGEPCSWNDACAGGVCKGSPVVCPPDSNACTVAQCDAVKGCVQVASAGSCDDKNPCTMKDTCLGGACVGTGVLDCDDKDTCTDDACLAGSGCSHVLAAACNDANSCTIDSCTLAAGCAHKDLYVGAACEDGDACTVWDFCALDAAKTLQCFGGFAASCDDNNVCSDDSCVAPGGCVHVPNAGPCDDFDPCTGPDTCEGDYCVGGLAKTCADDGNPCTVDYCISMAPAGLANAATADVQGCVHQAISGNCEDGNPCTSGDKCDGLACAAGAGDGCDDKNACTLDACDTSAGKCAHTAQGVANACDDGNACTLADVCDAATGACAGPALLACADADPCTADACDPKLGCVHPPLCDDGDACTEDVCVAGACSHGALSVFKEDFSGGNANGWTFDAEWEIGAAEQGLCGNLPPGDPASDHSLGGDNMVAGVDIGGTAQRESHAFRYLTSPAIDTTSLTYPALEFWRWLQGDMSPYMVNTVEVFDGKKWHVIWHPLGQSLVNDKAWTRVAYDISKYKSANFRFRIGFSVPNGDTVLAVGSWSIDDVTVGASWTCIENPMP